MTRTPNDLEDLAHDGVRAARRRPLGAYLLIALGGLALYLPGLHWGLPGNVSWSQDTIAGTRTLGAVAEWPAQWKARYAPLHYLILHALYQPSLRDWRERGEVTVDEPTGQPVFQPPHAPKLTQLYLIARQTSVVMAILALVGLFHAARVMTNDDGKAILAAVVLMTGAAFTYFAHLGNVDVPSIFWFTWSLFFYARAFRSNRWYDCALLGLLAGCAAATKDALAGMYPGMAIVLLAQEIHRRTGAAPTARAVAAGLLRPRWLIGLAAMIIPYLAINGVFHGTESYLARMRYWLDPTADTLHARQYHYASQFALLKATVIYAAGAVGWPMLAAMAASSLYALRRYRNTALAILLPALGYYLIVITQVGFVYSRFLLAPLALLGILVGVAVADLWRSSRFPLILRMGLPLVVFLPTAALPVAIDLEMLRDSRYEAEAWFEGNVEPPSSIGAFIVFTQAPFRPQYLPRIHEMGYATYPVEMRLDSFERPQPDYLILTSYDYDDFDDRQQACMAELLAGRLGYDTVAMFAGARGESEASWLNIAGFGAPAPGKISPTLIVLRRRGP